MIRTLTLLLLLCAPLTWAQDDDTGTKQAEETSSTAETATDSAPQTSTSSPFDYEASEQISEDLSVSFPVDI